MDQFSEDTQPNEIDDEDAVSLPIEWHVPDTIVPRYATNMVIQHTEHEFIVSFFELIPPVIIGSPQEQEEQALRLGVIRANCVARLVIADSRMPNFVKVLESNLKTWHERFKQEQEEGSNE